MLKSEGYVLFRFSECMSKRNKIIIINYIISLLLLLLYQSGFNNANRVIMSVIRKRIYFAIRFYTIIKDQRIYQLVNLKTNHVQPTDVRL